MDSKTRVMNILGFKKADRIGLYDVFWREFREKAVKHLHLPEDAHLPDYFKTNDIKIPPGNIGIIASGAEIISEDNEYKIERNEWGSVWKRLKTGHAAQFIEPGAKSSLELQKLNFDSPGDDRRFKHFREKSDSFKADGKCVFGRVFGPYRANAAIIGEENFLMDIAAEPELAKDNALKMAEYELAVGIEQMKRGGLHDTGIWIYDDMGTNSGPIMSPDSFEYIFYPAYKRLAGGLKEAGAKKVGLHSDGNILKILDMLIDSGIDFLNPVEPKAGLKVPSLLKKYGRKLAYVGGMCNARVLPSGSREEIISATMEILEAAAGGGVIIGSHSIGPDIPVENYLIYHETVMEKGRF